MILTGRLRVVSLSFVPRSVPIPKWRPRAPRSEGSQALGEQLLIALDGNQDHTRLASTVSTARQTQHGEQTTYSHAVVTPVVVAQGQRFALPLAPEFITPQDGHRNKDCETAPPSACEASGSPALSINSYQAIVVRTLPL